MVTKEYWKRCSDQNGKVINPSQMKQSIFWGGLDPDIRAKAWKFLLNFYPWDSNKITRQEIRIRKKEEYEIIKQRWKQITPEQLVFFDEWKKRKDFIKKDVLSTPFDDLDTLFDETQRKEYQEKTMSLMLQILYCYNFYNWNIGYSIGMNQLLYPFTRIFKEESTIFWCFAAKMDKLKDNFVPKKRGLLCSILKLSKIFNYMDPWFYATLASISSLDFLCCIRWIQLLFIGVFPVDQIFLLWDTIFSDYLMENEPNGELVPKTEISLETSDLSESTELVREKRTTSSHQNYILFFLFGILLQCRENILEFHSQEWPYEEMLKELKIVSRKLNLIKCLKVGCSLCLKFSKMGSLLNIESQLDDFVT
uniref:Rab-GAP TBC domain-containing protein n=1 Tax=Arcella intermedia TaxID=1963864 RepID=A0A6B2L7J8_9EUKA